ncbi:MAG: class I SAM-dependent methyltransferase [Patescibacteria group bacterium]|nr:class I SAM-dependent methyltransferase [Patescibacteria group bacterium]
MKQNQILTTSTEKDYELLDSGDGEKLERFGAFVLSRPDPQALWSKSLPQKSWDKADAVFVRDGEKGKWKLKDGMPKKWPLNFAGLKFLIEPTLFKHVGLFPEQKSNWEWIKEQIKTQNSKIKNKDQKNVKILNLFGYTGGATLVCAAAGAAVTHIDGSKTAVKWASENAAQSGLKEKPIRWIVDDARDFVKREIKRGEKYDAIIMDPPSFGRGDKGQVWKIEEDFTKLFDDCLKLLSDKPLFFLVNGYAAGYSSVAYANNLKIMQKKFGGAIEYGELAIEEKGTGRLLPAGIFARWSK